MTYSTEGVTTDLLSIITAANASKTVNLCLNSSSISLTGNRMAVQVMPYATGQGSIQVPPEQDKLCD
jgi:hypothetical protein